VRKEYLMTTTPDSRPALPKGFDYGPSEGGRDTIFVQFGCFVFPEDSYPLASAIRKTQLYVASWLEENLDDDIARIYLRRLKDRFDPRVKEIREAQRRTHDDRQ
jgi:hypothetical protein